MTELTCRHFVSYSGVRLPRRFVETIPATALANCNVCFCALFAENGRLAGFDELVYGEAELSHRYDYHGNGQLRRAEISRFDEAAIVLLFDESGARYPSLHGETAS